MTSDFLKKFLAPQQIATAIDEVVAAALVEDVDVALAGGVAMQLYGSDRLTKDVDFLADDVLESIPTDRRLSFGGQAGRTPSGVPVDLIVRDDKWKRLYEDALERAPFVKELGVHVVSVEFLAAIKLAAGRRKDEDDLYALVKSGNLDLPAVQAVVREYLGEYAVEEFDSVVEEVAWRRSRGKE